MKRVFKKILQNIFSYNLCLDYEYKRRQINENRID